MQIRELQNRELQGPPVDCLKFCFAQRSISNAWCNNTEMMA